MTMSVPAVLCIVGLSGVGKSEAGRIATACLDLETIHFGGVVLDEVRRRGLPITPDNEALVREELRARFGMDVMAKRSLEKVLRAVAEARSVLVDGLYSYAEYTLFREQLGDRLKTLAIHSDKQVRAQRLANRPVRPLTLVEMELRDQREIANLDKAPPIVLADFHVVNNGDIAAFTAALHRCFRQVFPAFDHAG